MVQKFITMSFLDNVYLTKEAVFPLPLYGHHYILFNHLFLCLFSPLRQGAILYIHCLAQHLAHNRYSLTVERRGAEEGEEERSSSNRVIRTRAMWETGKGGDQMSHEFAAMSMRAKEPQFSGEKLKTDIKIHSTPSNFVP